MEMAWGKSIMFKTLFKTWEGGDFAGVLVLKTWLVGKERDGFGWSGDINIK
jgi:hypothetical protein